MSSRRARSNKASPRAHNAASSGAPRGNLSKARTTTLISAANSTICSSVISLSPLRSSCCDCSDSRVLVGEKSPSERCHRMQRHQCDRGASRVADAPIPGCVSAATGPSSSCVMPFLPAFRVKPGMRPRLCPKGQHNGITGFGARTTRTDLLRFLRPGSFRLLSPAPHFPIAAFRYPPLPLVGGRDSDGGSTFSHRIPGLPNIGRPAAPRPYCRASN
jgi:hypothetical protein